MEKRRYDEPSKTMADDGYVFQSGPGGTAVTFDPGAALETGHRLIEDGLRAERQREEKTATEKPGVA